MEKEITQQQANEELENGYSESKTILDDKEKTDDLLINIENKLKTVPMVGGKLSHIPVFIQLIRDFTTKKYTKILLGSIIAVVSALIYFLNPIDLINDALIGIGYVDDAAVIGACLKLIDKDVEEYLKWRDNL